MAQQVHAGEAAEIKLETKRLKRGLTLLPLTGIIYFTVCGGTFGIEPLIGGSGPGLALLMILLTPLIFSVPLILMVREMTSMMPVEGGYYHWIKQAFGPFAGFLAGWMNLMVSWLDASIYPVLAAAYLAFFFPILDSGVTVAGIDIPGTTVSFALGVMLIWLVTALQIRGARLTGLTTNWIGLFILIPLALMTILGMYNWIQAPPTDLPFMPPNTDFTGAFGLGLFVVMWNYMGFELATVAGDEIVNPKRTYPIAMGIVLVLTIATYLLPVTAGLMGGAGGGGRYLLWGAEATQDGETITTVLEPYGVDAAKLTEWGVDPEGTSGWYLPDIAQAVGDQTSGSGSSLGSLLGGLMTIGAALSMVGLFIGNSLGGSRIPFALSEDGMAPNWLVRVSPKYGTPWVAIIVAGVIYTVFASNAFAFLVVADVLLNMLVLIACFFALWKLRRSRPDQPRKKVPGGYLGLALVTLGPIFITVMAVYSQWVDVGSDSITLAVVAIIVGAILYFPIRRFVKPGIPDIDPFQTGEHTA